MAFYSDTPLLSVMLSETILNDANGGWLATINYIGYMLGAFIAASISDLRLKDKLYRIGLIIAVISTIGMALAENYILWSRTRFIAGFSSAAGLLMGTGLVLNWMLRHGRKPELGQHFSGVGLGIATTAAMTMLMSGRFDWAQQWLIFTLVAAVLAIPAWFWLPPPDSSNKTKSGEMLVV